MWVLLISLYMNSAINGLTQSKGMIHAPQLSHEQCEQERDRVNRNWQMVGYRVSARCIYVKHYSHHNGAYGESDR